MSRKQIVFTSRWRDGLILTGGDEVVADVDDAYLRCSSAKNDFVVVLIVYSDDVAIVFDSSRSS